VTDAMPANAQGEEAMSSAVTGPGKSRAGALAVEWAPRLLSVLRIVAALLFLEHGMQKLFGFPPPLAAAGGSPALFTLLWFAGVLEFVGGLLLLVGLFTRPVAFVLSGEMALAYWMAHAPHGPFPALNGGDAAILYCFVFLYLAAAGPGLWSVDPRPLAG
jgi:putative oxidoreductase